jgi:hypothetical protein
MSMLADLLVIGFIALVWVAAVMGDRRAIGAPVGVVCADADRIHRVGHGYPPSDA